MGGGGSERRRRLSSSTAAALGFAAAALRDPSVTAAGVERDGGGARVRGGSPSG